MFSDKPFPFWLYERSPLAYLVGLVRFSALEHIPGRLALLLGRATLARSDGYHDYEVDYRKLDLGVLREQLARERPTVSENPRDIFPAADRLKDVLAALPPSTRVVLAWPPVHISALPQPGSAAETTMRACHAAFASLVAHRPRTAEVDWAVDRLEAHVADNFFDQAHYIGKLADALQKDIAAALNTLAENP
jgi:hypothetical protein